MSYSRGRRSPPKRDSFAEAAILLDSKSQTFGEQVEHVIELPMDIPNYIDRGIEDEEVALLSKHFDETAADQPERAFRDGLAVVQFFYQLLIVHFMGSQLIVYSAS